MQIHELIIGGIIVFILGLAFMIPYKDMNDKMAFDTENTEISDNIISFSSELNSSYDEANENLNESTRIKPIFTSITESFDKMGSLIQAGLDTASKSTKMLEGSTKTTTNILSKSNIPFYFILGLLAILAIWLTFKIILLITGRG